MEFFTQLTHNYILVCSVLGWTLAQVIKTLLTWIVLGKFDIERMFGAGGMPSGHSATVSALVVSTAIKCGADSVYFAFAVVLAAVVIYDAMGIRRAAGDHAKVINRIIKINNEDDIEENDIDMAELKELLGHTPIEVLSGVVLGVIIPFVIPLT